MKYSILFPFLKPFLLTRVPLSQVVRIQTWLDTVSIRYIKCNRSATNFVLDRSLMIGWRKHYWNPERVSPVFTFVRVCMCVCITGLQNTPFDIGTYFFGLNNPWDMRKKSCFFVVVFFFEIYIFTLFIGISRLFSYTFFFFFFASSYWSQFFS